jgi:hypothetical protein
MLKMPWTRRREERERLDAARERAFLSALDAVVKTVTVSADAVVQSQVTLQTYLELFKVEGKPESQHPHNDYSEVLKEADHLLALKEAGFPVDLSPLEQLQWTAAKADFTPDLLT